MTRRRQSGAPCSTSANDAAPGAQATRTGSPPESDDTTAVVALVVASGLAVTNTRRGVEKETAMRSKPPSARKGGAGAAAAPDGAPRMPAKTATQMGHQRRTARS